MQSIFRGQWSIFKKVFCLFCFRPSRVHCISVKKYQLKYYDMPDELTVEMLKSDEMMCLASDRSLTITTAQRLICICFVV